VNGKVRIENLCGSVISLVKFDIEILWLQWGKALYKDSM